VRLSHGIRINSGFNKKNAEIYVTGFDFFMPTLTERKQKPKKNSNRAIKEGTKLVYAYVASFNFPPCKSMYVLDGTKTPIEFPSHNLLV
jgi:hypothetical protein